MTEEEKKEAEKVFQEKLAEVNKLVEECELLADNIGKGFTIRELNQIYGSVHYVPRSIEYFKREYDCETDEEALELMDTDDGQFRGAGWVSSAGTC